MTFVSPYSPLSRRMLKFLNVRTTRKWRERKRAEVRKVEKAINRLQLGCAYTPVYQQVGQMRDAVVQAKSFLAQSEWGR